MKKVPLTYLREHGALLISNVQDGMQQNPHEILSMTGDEYLHWLRKLALKSRETGCFADFYFGRINDDERASVLSHLSDSSREYIASLDIGFDDLYYQLDGPDDPGLAILADLSARELLFSTFYFTRPRCTVWGNYDLKYPVFYG